MLLSQATNDDSVFTPSSAAAAVGGEFNVDLVVHNSTNTTSLGIGIYGGADPVTRTPAAVFIDKLPADGLAAIDGRLHAGN